MNFGGGHEGHLKVRSPHTILRLMRSTKPAKNGRASDSVNRDACFPQKNMCAADEELDLQTAVWIYSFFWFGASLNRALTRTAEGPVCSDVAQAQCRLGSSCLPAPLLVGIMPGVASSDGLVLRASRGSAQTRCRRFRSPQRPSGRWRLDVECLASGKSPTDIQLAPWA